VRAKTRHGLLSFPQPQFAPEVPSHGPASGHACGLCTHLPSSPVQYAVLLNSFWFRSPRGAVPSSWLRFSLGRCLPSEALVLHDSTRLSSPCCPHPATENSRGPAFSRTPKVRFRHTPGASAGCTSHSGKEIHGRFPDRRLDDRAPARTGH